MLHFSIAALGLEPDMRNICLDGRSRDGERISTCARVFPVGCGNGHMAALTLVPIVVIRRRLRRTRR